jgi:hypothetical protein
MSTSQTAITPRIVCNAIQILIDSPIEPYGYCQRSYAKQIYFMTLSDVKHDKQHHSLILSVYFEPFFLFDFNYLWQTSINYCITKNSRLKKETVFQNEPQMRFELC